MSVRKRAAGTAASPDLDTPDTVKKRKKNDVSDPVSSMRFALFLASCGSSLGSVCSLVSDIEQCDQYPCRGIFRNSRGPNFFTAVELKKNEAS